MPQTLTDEVQEKLLTSCPFENPKLHTERITALAILYLATQFNPTTEKATKFQQSKVGHNPHFT
jgi:hypothetical protein